jgi:Lantibiotic biosynthesis dehydratase C-term
VRMRRTFPPGFEWTYLKLYTGSASADLLLREMVAPLAHDLTSSGAADRRFFLRQLRRKLQRVVFVDAPRSGNLGGRE